LRLPGCQRRQHFSVHANSRITFKLKYLTGNAGNHGGQQAGQLFLKPARFLFPDKAVFFISNSHIFKCLWTAIPATTEFALFGNAPFMAFRSIPKALWTNTAFA
jgi:hypothetical protein